MQSTLAQVDQTRERQPNGNDAMSIRTRVLAALAGLAGCVATYLVLTQWHFAGVAWIAGALAIVCMPSSARLDRRVALNLAVILGWTPVLWWIDWPMAVNHGALSISLALGVCSRAGWLTSRGVRGWVGWVIPRARWSDILLPVGVVFSLFSLQRLLYSGSPASTLGRMLPGYDNAAHFNIYSMLLSNGRTLSPNGLAQDGSRWAYDNYPSGFHALAASITELAYPAKSSGPELLPFYALSLSVVVLLATLMATAAILSVPTISDHIAIAIPVVGFTWVALLWGPGQQVLAEGFSPFWWGGVATGTTLILVIQEMPQWSIADVAAVSGLFVATTHSWLPLILLSAPAGFVVLLVTGSSRDLRPGKESLLRFGILALGAIASLDSVRLLLSEVTLHALVTSSGGISPPAPYQGALLFVLAIALLICLVLLPGSDGGAVSRLLKWRLGCLMQSPLIAGITLFGFIALQVHTLGQGSYYAIKYFAGCQIVFSLLIAALSGVLLTSLASRSRWAFNSPLLGLVALVLVSQIFGRFPIFDTALWNASDGGTANLPSAKDRERLAAEILCAVDSERDPFRHELLLMPGNEVLWAAYPGTWYHALTGSMSQVTLSRLATLGVMVSDNDDAARLAGRVLREHPDFQVLVSGADSTDMLSATAEASRVATVVCPR